MYKQRILPLMLCLSATVAGATSLLCAPPARQKSAARVFTLGGTAHAFWPWMQEKWTANDQPYLRVRREVDALVRQAEQSPRAVALITARMQQAAQAAIQDPSEPLVQFRRAYLSERARRSPVSTSVPLLEDRRVLFDIYSMLESARPRGSYQYNRLLYLTYSRQFNGTQLKVLGKRLLARDPYDVDVKYFLGQQLGSSDIQQEQDTALGFAQELQKVPAERGRGYRLQASVYQDRWNRNHIVTDVDKSIASYRKYVAMAPPHSQGRNAIMKLIAVLGSEKSQRAR